MADKEIHPRFFLPPNVVGLGYKNTTEETDDFNNADNVELIITDADFITDSAEDVGGMDENRLLPPDYIELISQTARVTSGGTVVDVVIDIEDVSNASQFDIKRAT